MPNLFTRPNPQKENGYTPIANEIMDQLAKVSLPAHEMRVLLAILRKTYGWSKKVDQISLTQFEAATGLDRRSVTRALKRLEARRLIVVLREGKRGTNWYRFHKMYDEWVVDNQVENQETGRGIPTPTPRDITAPTVVGVNQPPTKTTLKASFKTSEKVIHIETTDNGESVRFDARQLEEQRQLLIEKLSTPQ